MVTRSVNEGATVHAPSLIDPVNNPLLPRLHLGVDLAFASTNGNPKCQRGSYSARSIAH